MLKEFRMELDALNGIYREQVRMNELLEQLVGQSTTKTLNTLEISPIEHKPARGRRKAQ